MKKIKLVGGPADGQIIEVRDKSNFVYIPFVKDIKIVIDENDVIPIVGWDDYGPIFKRDNILQARYTIQGDVGVYGEIEI